MSDIVVLDGGLGQEIQKRSNEAAHPLWSVKVMFEKPELVIQVHNDFIKNGAKVICLNTYTATRTRMFRHGFGNKLEEAYKKAIKLARKSISETTSIDDSVQLAGCLPPLVSSYVAEVSMNFKNSLEEYRQLVDFQKNDVNLFLIETMSNIEEARAAIRAVKETDKPVFVSLTLKDDNSNRLRSGEELNKAIEELDFESPDGIMLNCSSPETITRAMPYLSKLGIPFGGYANGFKSVEPLTPGSTVDNLSSRKELTPENYFKFVTEWINDGATIIGGCCEISPVHIGYICKMLELNGHNITKIKI